MIAAVSYRALIAVTVLFLSSCSGTSDEQKVRAVIAAAEAAIEKRDTSDAMQLIADNYRDDRGLDKTGLQNFLRAYLFTHPKIELVVHIDAIEIETPTRARATIGFALIGTEAGASLTGELETLTVEFQRLKDEWLVTRVDRLRS
ncbi:MAG: hypothetical protein H7Y02_01415 [Candidatus Obscuribacterales bacterium]|nr:hypothetical protein [Steroidobacteraceae bacterium]